VRRVSDSQEGEMLVKHVWVLMKFGGNFYIAISPSGCREWQSLAKVKRWMSF